jgi:hypothetical protein
MNKNLVDARQHYLAQAKFCEKTEFFCVLCKKR